ncbi:MAG: hypothetical protein R3E89_18415 [Thiolinea sp.]
MLDTLKRSIIPVVAAILAVFALMSAHYWLAVLCLAVVALGLYDWMQRKWTITRNFPVAGRLRWLFYELRPYLRAYIVEDNLHGTPYSFEARNLIQSRARGETDTHPFGTERDVESADYHWVGHSMVPEPEPDTHPRVQVGNEQCSQPYSASVLNISAMSFGSLSANAVRALNIGAKQGGFTMTPVRAACPIIIWSMAAIWSGKSGPATLGRVISRGILIRACSGRLPRMTR